ncbi:MAG: histidinol-phosphatase HisJ family protein [Oscillospiraceae bacterium]|nr:histidinol-phosphatase HisJ family protein [Oscillospiraceae bacterium]
MLFTDCHTHTVNSPDGLMTAEEAVQAALKIGLDVIALTDHCEANRFFSSAHYGASPGDYKFDIYDYSIPFERSMRDNTLAKNRNEGKITVLCGIELGQATFDEGLAESIASDKRLDFVIASMHQIPDKKDYVSEDFAFMDYGKVDVQTALREYFGELYKLCRWGKFDALGHLTYTLRYIEGEWGLKPDMSEYEGVIRDCFKLLAQKGLGIEINTSGLRQKYGKTFPDLSYIKMFREAGGEIVTLGSDAHNTADLSKGIKEGAELALAAGFKRICYFKERKPYFADI